MALPMNQAMPKPVSNTPNALLLWFGATTPAITALSKDPYVAIPSPKESSRSDSASKPPDPLEQAWPLFSEQGIE